MHLSILQLVNKIAFSRVGGIISFDRLYTDFAYINKHNVKHIKYSREKNGSQNI
jgi:hypothetical protein